MEMYFIKSAACLAVLLIFYKLMLEKENMHVFKRYYLLSSVLAALVIPFITFITYVEPSSEKFNALIYTSEISSETTSVKPDLSYIFYGIYLVGFLFFSVKFIRNLRDLLVKIRTNPKVSAGSFINVLLSEKVQPHTFFSFIFFNKEKYLKNEIPQDVKIHEQAHARQKHSLDVIFIELLQIIFWFNPLIFLLKDAVKLNHEFLADREVIQNGITTSTYQQTLLAYSSRDLQSVLVNPINYSSIKKRFTVMKTKTSRKTIWARGLLLLPLAVGLLYGFSTKEVVEKNMKDSRSIVGSYEILELTVDKKGQYFLNNVKMSLREIENLGWENYSDFSINAAATAPQESIQELVELIMAKRTEKEGKISVCTYGESGGEDSVLNKIFKPVQQDKATPEMIAEYNRLVNKLNETGVINQKDLDRFNIISRAMTAEQKKNSV